MNDALDEIIRALPELTSPELDRVIREATCIEITRSIRRARDAACERLSAFDAGQVPESRTSRKPRGKPAESLGATETSGNR